MDRWVGKVAVVTGASSGIGARIAIDLAKAGMIVVAMARRLDRLEELTTMVTPSRGGGILHPYKCDVTNDKEVVDAFAWIDSELGGVDVLVNNAGVLKPTKLTAAGNTEMIRQTIETNLFSYVLCTREAFQSMKRRGFAGHIFLMNSIGGHAVPRLDSFNIYHSTKHGVTAMTEVLRQEFQTEGTRIKITVIYRRGKFFKMARK